MSIVGDVPTAPVEPTPAPRQCGRCRQLFDGDPTMPPGVIAGWWLCGPCRISLGIDRRATGSSC